MPRCVLGVSVIAINLYGGLILGVNTLYRLFCFFKLFPMVSKGLIAERLSARQLILHRVSAGVCIYIYVCVTLRNAILLRAAHAVAAVPALLLLTSHVLATSTYVYVYTCTYVRIYVG